MKLKSLLSHSTSFCFSLGQYVFETDGREKSNKNYINSTAIKLDYVGRVEIHNG